MCIAQSAAMEKGVLRKDRITHGWWQKFVQRQGDLSLRRGENISNIRMDAVNVDTMRHYFDLLETTLKVNRNGIFFDKYVCLVMQCTEQHFL